MNPIPAGAFDADSPFRIHDAVDTAVFPTFIDVAACIAADLPVGAQFGRAEANGAFTGDVSMAMLKHIGCTYVLCGHSERRQYHHETNEDVATMAKAAVDAGLQPIVCVGETLEEREAGRATDVVEKQLEAVMDECIINNAQCTMIIAYEPVWAIGTGQTATPEQAQEMHAFIRGILPAKNEEIRILYGGSMKPENAADLLGQPDIDGGLIGGASLQKESFTEIVNTAKNMA